MGCTEPERPHVFVVPQRDRWAFFLLNVHFILPLELICWFTVKAQILSVSQFGSPLLSRSKIMIFFSCSVIYILIKIMIYVFISSPLYLNRRNLSCCRFWLITWITINYTFYYLIIFCSMPSRWVFVTLGVNFASKLCLNNEKKKQKKRKVMRDILLQRWNVNTVMTAGSLIIQSVIQSVFNHQRLLT